MIRYSSHPDKVHVKHYIPAATAAPVTAFATVAALAVPVAVRALGPVGKPSASPAPPAAAVAPAPPATPPAAAAAEFHGTTRREGPL